MPANNRTVDLLVEAFDLNQRRKFELKNAAGDVIVELYFKPITRADRKKAQSLAGTDEALDISTQMLCQMAELEDGTKAFASADAAKLQRQLPENRNMAFCKGRLHTKAFDRKSCNYALQEFAHCPIRHRQMTCRTSQWCATYHET